MALGDRRDSRSRRTFAACRFAALALCALLAPAPAAMAAQTTVSWDPAPEDTIVGYKLYLAPSGQDFAAPVDAGPATSHTLTGLEPARVYRVAVSAYDVFDQEGALSAELLFTAPDDLGADADADGLPDALEQAGCTDPNDDDTDDDGLADGTEDADRDGARAETETNPCDADTDGDGLADGTEDANRNGRLDPGETDPLTPDNPLLFADDFSDGSHAGDPSWRRVSGRWSVTPGGRYASSPTAACLTLAAAPAVADFASGRIESLVRLTGSGAGAPNAEIVFDVRDARHYRYVRITPAGISVGQVGSTGAEGPGMKASRARRFALNRWHRLRIEVEGGALVRVSVGAATLPALTYRFRDGLSGRVGYRTTRARSLFDDFAVSKF